MGFERHCRRARAADRGHVRPAHPLEEGGLCDLLLDSSHGIFQPLLALGKEVGQGPFAHGAGEQIVQQLAGALIGQELRVVQIDGRGPGAWTVLHRGVDPGGEGPLVPVAAGAEFDFGLMLGDHPLPGGQVVDLSFLDLLGWLIAQRTTAALARVHASTAAVRRLSPRLASRSQEPSGWHAPDRSGDPGSHPEPRARHIPGFSQLE